MELINVKESNTIKYCPNCKSVPYQDDKFCFKCGIVLYYKCCNCNHIILQKEFDFCPNCGVKIKNNKNK